MRTRKEKTGDRAKKDKKKIKKEKKERSKKERKMQNLNKDFIHASDFLLYY
jgi:elongation factor P--beta-lysine ligase